ncbi:MAG: glycerophosphodiester phosphodiesterase [Beutenbergiaceae bacterium]
MIDRPAVIAHRGNSSVAPENTMAAFETALRVGSDAIELDLQVTSDGEAAVIHNPTFNATTNGIGFVNEHPSSMLAELDAGSWFAPAFAQQHVPTLPMVLDWLGNHERIGLLVEVKEDWPLEPLERVLAALGEPGIADRVVVQSLSVVTMELARQLAPASNRELLIDSFDMEVLDLCQDLQVGGCNPRGDLLVANPDLLEYLHGAGLRVSAWTLNEPMEWALATAAGVDGIITDRPGHLLGWLAAARSTMFTHE